MAGHSKWKGIKHKKAIVDAQRGKAFSKVIREITAAARLGGGQLDANPRLRLAMQKAKEVNPRVKVVVITGSDEVSLTDVTRLGATFLKKPIRLEELDRLIRQLMARNA